MDSKNKTVTMVPDPGSYLSVKLSWPKLLLGNFNSVVLGVSSEDLCITKKRTFTEQH